MNTFIEEENAILGWHWLGKARKLRRYHNGYGCLVVDETSPVIKVGDIVDVQGERRPR